MTDIEQTTWGVVVTAAISRIETNLAEHAKRDDVFHDKVTAEISDLKERFSRQGQLRALYFVLTVAALYANGIHAPHWLFQLLNGMP